MPLPLLFAGSAERHTLVERDILADDRGLSDHHTHAMIDEQTPPHLRSRMDFNAGEPARHLRQPARQQKEIVVPQPVVHAIEPHRVQTGVAEINLQPRLGRRIALQHGGNILAN